MEGWRVLRGPEGWTGKAYGCGFLVAAVVVRRSWEGEDRSRARRRGVERISMTGREGGNRWKGIERSLEEEL